jgi:tetrahydromethanopterin S-methyltransferase subunit E
MRSFPPIIVYVLVTSRLERVRGVGIIVRFVIVTLTHSQTLIAAQPQPAVAT